ncbi:TolC family protein [Terriglobus tenax]|uniref:TolC family protein n=1 Tax=Terriglobus tenax TaxID=1111115 RepID=UPI0021DFFB9A|nr:TolC family protein [Terriglobus tenax]
MKMRWAFCLVLPLLSVAWAGAQQSTSPPLTLQQALDFAHKQNPSLLSAMQHVEAVKAGETTAGLRQNPVLTSSGQMVTLGPDDPNGPDFYTVGVQRLFERGNKRAIRLDAARATTALTDQQRVDLQRQTDFAIKQAFTRMLFAKDALRVSQDNLEGYRKTVALMQVRLDAGDMSRNDFSRVELQLAGFENDTDNARLALTQASTQLQSLMGIERPAAGFDVVGALDTAVPAITLEDLKQKALDTRPDVKAAAQQVAVNQAGVRLAYANGTSDPTVEGEYEHSGHANTAGFNLQIPIRVFDRNQGEKERAKYELESSRLALTATRNQAVADVDQAFQAYQTAQAQAARYRTKYLDEAKRVRDNLEFSYRNGQGTLLDYLSALQDYRSVNLQSLTANAQLQLAIHQLSFVTYTEILP